VKTYDLVLLYTLSRVHNHYLSVIRHLGRRLRIAVYVARTEKIVKTAETERLFLDLCARFGADVLDGGRVSAGVLALPQARYDAGFLEALVSEVTSRRRVALQTFGHGRENLEPLSRAGAERLYVYDRAVFANKLRTEEDRRFIDDRFELVEMGTPFIRHPVFEPVSTDYMIAVPTELSFVDAAAKAAWARSVNRLVDDIPALDTVMLKLHNVSDGGRLSERGSRAFRAGRALGTPLAGAAAALLAAGGTWTKGRAGEALARIAFGAEYHRLAGRTQALDDVTPYFNLGLELFLPGVGKGLITGRSSVVWYALVQRLPVYNCDAETERARADSVHDSYRAFGVPPCGGRLRFDPTAFSRIADTVRDADLLDLLQKEL
jgi:hypothetical protein